MTQEDGKQGSGKEEDDDQGKEKEQGVQLLTLEISKQ